MTALHRNQATRPQAASGAKPPFPFTAIVGQDDMRLAMTLTAIDPLIGGVLVFGDRGTGKSTAVRGLAALLPPIRAVTSCPVNSADPSQCPPWAQITDPTVIDKPTPVVDLPLGVSEDRVTGALDVERAIAAGVKAFEPGLLARANRGYLYIDEVNLLEDHIVDLLLDVAQSGENVVERDGLSIRHPARFVLVGSGNPDIATRVEVVLRREDYESDPFAFAASYGPAEADLRETILKARAALPKVKTPRAVLEDCAALCIALGSDGVRGELTLLRAARALAASEAAPQVTRDHLRRIASMSLGHRLRRDPLDEAGASDRVARAVSETLA